MDIFVYAVTLVCALLSGGFLLVFVRLSSRKDANSDLSWLELFSMERYRPMARLLGNDDVKLLQASGASGRTIHKFRADRRRIFRGYLHDITRDFVRISNAIKIVSVRSQYDRPELAHFLMQQHVAFARALVTAQVRLALHTIGFDTLAASDVLHGLELMHTRLQSLMQLQPSVG